MPRPPPPRKVLVPALVPVPVGRELEDDPAEGLGWGWENRVLHLNSQSDLGIAASIFCVRRAADA